MKSNLNPEERAQRKREQTAVRQQKFREKKRSPIPEAWDYQMPTAQSGQLKRYSDEFSRKVAAELDTNLMRNDDFVIDGIASTTLALENGWRQTVNEPTGILAGGYFPDSIASTAIRHLRDSRLLHSPTFVELYRRFLKTVAVFCREANQNYLTKEYVAEIKQQVSVLDATEVAMEK